MSRKGVDYKSTASRALIVAAPRGLVEEGLVFMERLIDESGLQVFSVVMEQRECVQYANEWVG